MNASGRFLLIVDYNLSRVDDVRAMSAYARERHGVRTILVRSNPGERDRALCDVVLDADPRRADFVERALRLLEPYRTALAGGIVFSDDAVHCGALLLERLGLGVDDAESARAAASKAVYRERETAMRELMNAQGMFVPSYRTIRTAHEVASFAAAHPAGFVVKPACEGNNRGVVVVRGGEDPRAALHEAARYLDDGVICEELIPYDREFSYDGLGDLAFITEKVSATGRYPVEIAQLLPAKLTRTERSAIERAGRLANLIVGQRNGPFHNEIKLARDASSAAVVEPNRRPAGMRIWQLAECVYGINLFERWVDAVLGEGAGDPLPEPRGFAATIMLGVPFDGRLRHGDRPSESESLARMSDALRATHLLPRGCEPEWFDFAWLRESGDCDVRAIPHDNGDFVARVCLRLAERPADAHLLVHTVRSAWSDAFFLRSVA